MDEDLLTAMREMLESEVVLHSNAGHSTWWRIFAENPMEAAELLERLFAAHDAGADNADHIRTVLLLRRSAHHNVSAPRTASLERMGAANAANRYPPTALQSMHQGLLGVVHQRDPAAACEAIVRDYPAAAQALLANFVREQRRDHFFDNLVDGVKRDTWPAINVLRGMIARVEARRLLDEMEGGT